MELQGQNLRDTLKLPEFEIKSDFILDNQGFKRVRFDSALFIPNLGADLSLILSEHSTLFIKSYGSGTLATPSFRGTSAQHTQVEWNGINLNSPMLGQMDFSQVPVAQFDGLEILYGAAGISRTSGAFGGVIDLVTKPDWNNHFKCLLAQTVASFGNYTTNLGVAAGKGSFQSHTKINYHTAVNNFPFTNDTGRVVRQKNASFGQAGISEELFWKWKDRHLLSLRGWYSQDNRNLPPTTENYDIPKTETLNDKAFRAVAEYKFIKPGWNLLLRSAFNDQYQRYENSFLAIQSTHKYYSWINRVRFSYSGISHFTIRPGIDHTFDHVNSSDYKGIKTRNTTTFYAEVEYNSGTWMKSSFVFREDLIDGKFKPFIPAIGLEFVPFRKVNFALSANAARNYRYPTLNELYWKDGGNPDLKPELNYITEAGTTFNIKSLNGRFFLESALTGYYSWIYDMVIWSQMEGSALFTPENIDEIHARGFELGINVGALVWGFNISLKNNYTFCRSTYEKAAPADQKIIGNQQMYIPVNLFNSTLNVERWKFYLTYNFTYTGERFTGKDHARVMPAYNLSNIILGKNIQVKQFILSLQFDINNFFNLDYQSVTIRPMPGINYAFTLKLSVPGKNGG